MFPYPIATPQGCNIQTFYGSAPSPGGDKTDMTWNKPVGVSHVYMLLIGGGGEGSGGNGGGSGAVTVWYGAAQHVPNSLVITPGDNSDASVVSYRTTSLRQLLLALGGSASTGGGATTAGPFAASGFYKSTAGQNGVASNTTASTTTFLSGGTSDTSSVTANYGYSLPTTTGNFAGIFQMQPIIVGLGSKGSANGTIGCGGGATGIGGRGMVLIASW